MGGGQHLRCGAALARCFFAGPRRFFRALTDAAAAALRWLRADLWRWLAFPLSGASYRKGTTASLRGGGGRLGLARCFFAGPRRFFRALTEAAAAALRCLRADLWRWLSFPLSGASHRKGTTASLRGGGGRLGLARCLFAGPRRFFRALTDAAAAALRCLRADLWRWLAFPLSGASHRKGTTASLRGGGAAQVLLAVARMEHASFWRLALNEARDETDCCSGLSGPFCFFAIF